MIRENEILPDISPFVFYIEAYVELSTCRNGFNPKIPFTAIVDYCNIYGIEDREEFKNLIRLMEDYQLELEESKNKKVDNGPKASKGNSSNSGHKGRA